MIGEEFAAGLAAPQEGSEAAVVHLWRGRHPARLRRGGKKRERQQRIAYEFHPCPFKPYGPMLPEAARPG